MRDVSLDERSVAWKIVLPCEKDAPLLVVGLNVGGIAGLARTWGRIDCLVSHGSTEILKKLPEGLGNKVRIITSLDEIRGKYRIIVLASFDTYSFIPIKRLNQLLSAADIVVCLRFLGCPLLVRDLYRYGFGTVRRYAALSKKHPRIFFPISSGRTVSKGLMFHIPGRRRIRWMLLIAKWLSQIGCKAHLAHAELFLATNSEAFSQENHLKQWLTERLGCPLSDMIVYAGSDLKRRKITALVLDKLGKKEFVVKIADTEYGAEAIRQESTALRRIASSPLREQAPQVVTDQREWNGYSIQVQTLVAGDSFRQTQTLTDAHFKFLNELSQIDRIIVPIHSTPAWKNLISSLDNIDLSNLPRPIVSVIKRFTRDNFKSKTILCHRTHGDFAPWNIRLKGDAIYVVDWEDSEQIGLPFTDALYFLYSRSELSGLPNPTKMLIKMKRVCERLVWEAELLKENIGDVLRFWLLNEYLLKPDSYLIAILESVISREGMK